MSLANDSQPCLALPRAATLACAILLVASALFALAGRSEAQSADSLNQRISDAQLKARALAADVEATTAALAGAQNRAASSLERETALSALLASGREREARIARAAAASETRLRAARERLHRAIGVLSDRLVAIYKSGEVNRFDLLLHADGFDDLVTRSDYLRRVEESDARLASRVRALRNDVGAEAEALQNAREAEAQLNGRLGSARRRIAGVRAKAEDDARIAARARDSQASTLASLRLNVAEWTRQVERIEQVSMVDAKGEVISWFGEWAIPQAIVMCESGGNYSALNPSSGAGGAYQILPSTWQAYGGKGLPHHASKAEQDQIAALIWRDSGPSAWVCTG